MRKPLILYIILLVFLAMCKKTPAVTVIPEEVTVIPENNNTANEKVEDADLTEISSEIRVSEIDINDKYIVLEESIFSEAAGFWYDNGICVYEYDKNLKTTEYRDSGNKLYASGDGPYHYKGIYNDLLFIDEGTGPDVRVIHIFDLANKEKILDAAYHGSYSFKNNIVSGLTMSGVKYGDYDDNIRTKFYELERSAERQEGDDGRNTRLVVIYNFNVLTKEINLLYGTYVFEQ
ncbi:hypothetical protein [Treponema sp. R80B11-R83G3]